MAASALAVAPALADISANDRNPTLFDGTSPLLTVQPPQFILGRSVEPDWFACGLSSPDKVYSSTTMRISWNADDAISGAASYDISRDTADTGPYLATQRTGATSLDEGMTNYDNDCGGGFHKSYLWVTARDHRGNTSTSPQVSDHIDVWDEAGVDRTQTVEDLTVSRSGSWSTSRCTCHVGGTTAYTTSRGASLTFTLWVDKPGRTVAVVAPTSTNRGTMNVSVDGGSATAVSTTISSTVNVNRVIVWQRTLDAGLHTIRIVNAGTSGRMRIDVDAIMLGPAWTGEAPRIYSFD